MSYNQNLLLLISCISYFLFSIALGYISYPQEDALILFRYVNNFAETGHLYFNIDGPPTEGATDFLWTIFLGLFLLIGVNPFVTTVIISTCSIFLIFKLIIKKIIPNQSIFFYAFFIIIFLNIGQITGASIYGFSTVIFCTICMYMYKYAFEGKYIQCSIASVIFCLFRPEAVLFFLPSIFKAYKTAHFHNALIHFYKSIIFIICVGLTYFSLRFMYFGELLPLPLIVKSIGGEISIIRFMATVSQLFSTLFISLCIVTIIYIFSYRKIFFKLDTNFIVFILITLSLIIYIFSLSTGFTSQNIFFRYFAPIYFFIFLCAMYSLAKINYNKFYLFILYSFLLLGSFDNSNLLNRTLNIEKRNITNPTYNIMREFNENSFKNHPLVLISTSLEKIEKKLKIMITEAGALPYITKFDSYDLAGLNNNLFAKRPVSCQDIDEINPDLIEIDLGPAMYLVNFDKILNNNNFPNCGIFSKELIYTEDGIINNNEMFYVDSYDNIRKEKHHNSTVSLAASNILYCMSFNEEYKNVFINKKSDQIYFFKDDIEIKKGLMESCEIDTYGYLQN